MSNISLSTYRNHREVEVEVEVAAVEVEVAAVEVVVAVVEGAELHPRQANSPKWASKVLLQNNPRVPQQVLAQKNPAVRRRFR
jgi:hypothetical protein